MRKTLALAVAATSWATCAPATAQEAGLYVGAALGQARLTQWCDPVAGVTITACEDTDTAWKLLGGYRFSRYVAIEATYIDWGKVSGTALGISATAEQTSLGIGVVGSLPINPQFSIFGKAGFLSTEQEIARSGATFKRDDTEFHYGLGVKYAFTANWAARAEWERTDQLRVEMLSIGAEFRF
jgi:OOP family OmpA-OmpF porin